jgi:signal transduction histidine kinase
MERVARVPGWDIALASVLTLVTIVTQGVDDSVPQPWITLVASVWSASIALRTVAPMTMAVVASLSAVGYAAFPVHTTLLVQFVVLLTVTFSFGERLTGKRLLTACALMVAAIYVVQITTSHRAGGDTDFGDVYVSPVVLLLPVLGGMLLRRSRRQSAELARLTAELAAEREAHGAAAAAAERSRIARELHDVVSHAVTVMVVQAGAADQLLDDEHPARPRVLAIRSAGKEALGELRRQLGLMRAGGPSSVSPLPGLDQLPELTEASGAPLTMAGDVPDGVPPGLALTTYRLVQEALTNAHRHAPGAAVDVSVERIGDELCVCVLDDGPGASAETGSGQGLRGMKERVEMYGGELEVGPRTDRPGWRVQARLPVTPDQPAGHTPRQPSGRMSGLGDA